MPNHIKNRLTVSGSYEKVTAFFKAIQAPEGRGIDFEKIIPPPDNIFKGGLGEQERQQCLARGIPNWYDWNIENWGTKWNAYDADLEGNVLTFETAWSHPKPIVYKITEMFPDIEILWEYADEDLGSNTGSYVIKGGKAVYHKIVNQSLDAYQMAFSLHPDSAENYELVDGEYRYKEESD